MGTWAFMTASKLLWPWKGAPCGLTIITVIRTSSSCSDTALLQEQIFPFLLTSSQCYPSFIAQSSAHLITSNWIPTENKIPILLLQHVATQPLLPPKACCLPGVLMQTPNTSLELLQAVEQPVPGQTGDTEKQGETQPWGECNPKGDEGPSDYIISSISFSVFSGFAWLETWTETTCDCAQGTRRMLTLAQLSDGYRGCNFIFFPLYLTWSIPSCAAPPKSY